MICFVLFCFVFTDLICLTKIILKIQQVQGRVRRAAAPERGERGGGLAYIDIL